jgi:hypothetical protein
MKNFKFEGYSEGIQKRRAIEAAAKYFVENPTMYFANVEVVFGTHQKGMRIRENIMVRREVLSQWLSVEVVRYWEKKGEKRLGLKFKEYLSLWRYLKKYRQIKGSKEWEKYKKEIKLYKNQKD